MKIAIFGASGRTGKLLCAKAFAAGHDVVAVVRDPSNIAVIAGVFFYKGYEFSSPRSAAAVVLGRSANGLVEWKTKAGQTL